MAQCKAEVSPVDTGDTAVLHESINMSIKSCYHDISKYMKQK